MSLILIANPILFFVQYLFYNKKVLLSIAPKQDILGKNATTLFCFKMNAEANNNIRYAIKSIV